MFKNRNNDELIKLKNIRQYHRFKNLNKIPLENEQNENEQNENEQNENEQNEKKDQQNDYEETN